MENVIEAPTQSRCAGCGAPFVCGAAAGLLTCWCMEEPTGLLEPVTGSGCYCENCLAARIAEHLKARNGNAPAA